jgi:hypothetical protein
MATETAVARPILLQGWGVRATLKGDKTQTRRVIKPQPEYHEGTIGAEYFGWRHPKNGKTYINMDPPLCLYGQPCDLLWVRETWCSPGLDSEHKPIICYRASGDPVTNGTPWRPSIHMSRCLSRLTLRITAIRVQRVQEITDGDVAAEGVDWSSTRIGNDHGSPARDAYAYLWDGLNAKRGYSWESNPWVWAISYEVVR